MAIPITYNVRNLRMRLGATVMTALGIALTVAIAIFIMALLAGLKQAFHGDGRSDERDGSAQGIGHGIDERDRPSDVAGDQVSCQELPRMKPGSR